MSKLNPPTTKVRARRPKQLPNMTPTWAERVNYLARCFLPVKGYSPIVPTVVPFAQRAACFFGLHGWTRWTAPYRYRSYHNKVGQVTTASQYQSRTCAACGKTSERRCD